MTFDFKKAALNLAAANNSLSRELHRLDYLDRVNVEELVAKIKVERSNVYQLQRKIWNMSSAEQVLKFVGEDNRDEFKNELIDWLLERDFPYNKSLLPLESILLLAIENGWEMFPEPPDSFGEPPLTMSEMHENSRREKKEAWSA